MIYCYELFMVLITHTSSSENYLTLSRGDAKFPITREIKGTNQILMKITEIHHHYEIVKVK